MNRQQAIDAAKREATEYGVTITVVRDLLSERDDGDDYEYAPQHAINMLYREHEVIEVFEPDQL